MKKLTATLLVLFGNLSGVYAYYIHANGPSYTCPNSELTYYYETNMPIGDLTFTITNGRIFNIFSQTWETSWTFARSTNPNLNETYPFRVMWDNLPIGTVGNVKVRICGMWCVEGNRGVTFGSSPGTPVIAGNSYLLNCQNQQQTYNVTSIPQNWTLSSWNYSSEIQQASSGLNTVTIQGTNTTYSGPQTLTGVFQFTTGGNTCATKNVTKTIWVGAPSPGGQTIDGNTYYSGYQICPGSHWVGIGWNGSVSSTSWQVWTGGSYYTTNTSCDFQLPSSGSSSVSISVMAHNACGSSYKATWYLSKKLYGCGSYMMAAYPNPASSELTIETAISNDTEGVETETVADEIVLFNESNSKVIAAVPTEPVTRIDTRKLQKGKYYLHVKFGNETIRKHIIIEK